MSTTASALSERTKKYTNYKESVSRIIATITNYKKANKISYGNLLKSTRDKITKESLISSLRQDLEFHKRENEKFKKYREYTQNLSNYFAKNKQEIEIYCKNLQEELKDFINMVNDFEEDQRTLVEDKNLLIKTSETILVNKQELHQKYEKQLYKTSKELSEQTKKLEEVTLHMNNLKEEVECGRNQLNSLEGNEIRKYDELKKKYDVVLKRYNYYHDIEVERQKKIAEEFEKKKENKREMQEVDIFLKDKKLETEYLMGLVNELKEKIKKFKEEEKEKKLESEREKFWGKILYRKLKAKGKFEDEKVPGSTLFQTRRRQKNLSMNTINTGWSELTSISKS